MNARYLAAAVVIFLMLTGCRQLTFFESPFSRKTDFNRELIPGLSQNTQLDSGPLHASAVGSQTAGDANRTGEPAYSAEISASRTAAGVVEELNRGHAAAASGDFEQATERYRRVLQLKPDHAEAHHRLAIIADKGQNYAAAEHHYLMALRSDSNNADLLSDLGYSYLLQRRYRESETALQQALGVIPNHLRALNNLGLLYGTQGDYERAMAMFRRAGSESDAQAKIAQLFPHGAPHPAGAAPGAAPQFIPAGGAPSVASGRGPRAADLNVTTYPPEVSDAPNEMTRQIKQQMEQARLAALAQRQHVTSGDESSMVSTAALPARTRAPTNHAAAQTAAATRLPSIRPGTGSQRQQSSARLPDGAINSAFAQIDRARGGSYGIGVQGSRIDPGHRIPDSGRRSADGRDPRAGVRVEAQGRVPEGNSQFASEQSAYGEHGSPYAGGAPQHRRMPAQAIQNAEYYQPAAGGMGNPYAAGAPMRQQVQNAAGSQADGGPSGDNRFGSAGRAAAMVAMDGGLFPLVAGRPAPPPTSSPGSDARPGGSHDAAPAQYPQYSQRPQYYGPQADRGAAAAPYGSHAGTPQSQSGAQMPVPQTAFHSSPHAAAPYDPAAAAPDYSGGADRYSHGALGEYEQQLRQHDAEYYRQLSRLQAAHGSAESGAGAIRPQTPDPRFPAGRQPQSQGTQTGRQYAAPPYGAERYGAAQYGYQ